MEAFTDVVLMTGLPQNFTKLQLGTTALLRCPGLLTSCTGHC